MGRTKPIPGLIIILGLSLAAGCATPRTDPAASASFLKTHSFWKPYLLYLLPSPHPRLHVEVDAVEGCEPSDAMLERLEKFLSTQCNKPEGIQLVRSDVIPKSEAKGLSRKAIAYKYLNGPREIAGGASAAFIYILFYDGKLADQHSEPKRSRERERKMQPHVELVPYPAIIYMNTRYGSKHGREEVLLHEASHLLGLARRPGQTALNHCLSNHCFMRPSINLHISRVLLGRDPIKQHDLCNGCKQELAEKAKLTAPANLRFEGPVLVRIEDGYSVRSLPSRIRLLVGSHDSRDSLAFVDSARNERGAPGFDNFQLDAAVKRDTPSGVERVREALRKAKADPFGPIRNAASKLESAFENRTQ